MAKGTIDVLLTYVLYLKFLELVRKAGSILTFLDLMCCATHTSFSVLLNVVYHPDHRPGFWIRNDIFQQCGGSGMFIPDAYFCSSRISGPGSKRSNKRGVKKLVVLPFLVTTKSQNWHLYFFGTGKETIWANLHRIIELSTQKIVIKLSKIWDWDPWSGKPIPDPRSRGQKGNWSQRRIRNTGFHIYDPYP